MLKNCTNCISDRERKRGSINCAKCVNESAWRPGVMVYCSHCAFINKEFWRCEFHSVSMKCPSDILGGCWDGWKKEFTK
jgi:hypothetical protein